MLNPQVHLSIYYHAHAYASCGLYRMELSNGSLVPATGKINPVMNLFLRLRLRVIHTPAHMGRRYSKSEAKHRP